MVSIPIENETPYTLTDARRQDMLRDAHEHFGDVVRSIRVQEGLERQSSTRARVRCGTRFPPRIWA
jgi:hypothetical protein